MAAVALEISLMIRKTGSGLPASHLLSTRAPAGRDTRPNEAQAAPTAPSTSSSRSSTPASFACQLLPRVSCAIRTPSSSTSNTGTRNHSRFPAAAVVQESARTNCISRRATREERSRGRAEQETRLTHEGGRLIRTLACKRRATSRDAPSHSVDRQASKRASKRASEEARAAAAAHQQSLSPFSLPPVATKRDAA